MYDRHVIERLMQKIRGRTDEEKDKGDIGETG